MYSWVQAHSVWLVVAAIAILFTVALTLYVFGHNRHIEGGPQKGVAAHPHQVARATDRNSGSASSPHHSSFDDFAPPSEVARELAYRDLTRELKKIFKLLAPSSVDLVVGA